MTRHTPFEDLDRLVEDLQARFEESRRLPEGVDWRRRGDASVDVVDADDEYVAAFDLPGYRPEDVDVRLTDRELTVSAEREDDRRLADADDDAEFVRRDRRRVASRQSVTFPRDVDRERATASLDHGVLTVTVPKRADTEGTRVDVE